MDDSLVAVQPPVSESLAEIAESTEPHEAEQEEEEQDEEQGDEENEEDAGEQEPDEAEEEEEEVKRFTLADIMGEKLRQNVQKKMSLKDDQLRIYSTA